MLNEALKSPLKIYIYHCWSKVPEKKSHNKSDSARDPDTLLPSSLFPHPTLEENAILKQIFIPLVMTLTPSLDEPLGTGLSQNISYNKLRLFFSLISH